jgi:SAM-dependent methyltransferase
MHPHVDYDTIAGTYDERYRHNQYPGVEEALALFVQGVGGRTLEVGCGTGHWVRLLTGQGIRLVGLDASAHMLSRAQAQAPGAALVRGAAEQLPWASASFDRLFCVNALHHFRAPETFLLEARRSLRPGGRMMTIGLDPHTGIDRWYIYDYFEAVLEIDRSRYPSSGRIRAWMHAAGFADCATREVQHLALRLPAQTAIEQGRLARDATSQLAVLTDEQYRKGLDRIRTDIHTAESRGEPLYLTADLRLYATAGSVPDK